ncbi:MAG: hypothetical protein K6G22_14760 [Lachnospiraceae bacterium]|nr:hypothetical protein [Lachnospiraceae bacterium]
MNGNGSPVHYTFLFLRAKEGESTKHVKENGGYYLIITNSQIGMESARKYTSVRRDAIMSLSAEVKDGEISDNKFKNSIKDLLSGRKSKEGGEALEDTALSSADDMKTPETIRTKTGLDYDKWEEDAKSRIRSHCILFLIRLLFGDKYDKYFDDDESQCPLEELKNSAASPNPYYYYSKVSEEHYFKETEETAFSAQGKVVTADGRELDFNISLQMSRSFEEYYKQESESLVSVMCDPLVINLDTDIAEVSDQKFYFDLDCDGKDDRISVLSGKSGFLALDKNEDGKINDGNELFGTKTGDGFYDLSKYDDDGNGFIDEADDIFDKLRICVFDEKGDQTLYKLKDKDVGAIFLGNVHTDFSLKDRSDNHTNAAIRKTGIFLYENGAAGTIQHLDLAKEMLA